MKRNLIPAVSGIAYRVGLAENKTDINLSASFNSRILCCYHQAKKTGETKFSGSENWSETTMTTKLSQPFIVCVADSDHIKGIQVSIEKNADGFYVTEKIAWKVVLDKEAKVRGGVYDIKIIRGLKRFICDFCNQFEFQFTHPKALLN